MLERKRSLGGLMRDPNRIDEIIERLTKVWKKHPNMRLGQMIMNAEFYAKVSLFFVEDENLVESVEELSYNIKASEQTTMKGHWQRWLNERK